MDERELRPDPEALLTSVKEEHRGKLKLFLGSAPGVGKTYAMLTEAQEKRKQGLDVMVGWVDTHGRRETEALLNGLEVLPRLKIKINGHTYEHLDVEAIIKRSPVTVVIDEMPHANPPGSVHAKRWQDIEEILDVGINVYSALNIQHLESLNGVVTRVTGVSVSETVPDRVFDSADEVRLVDLPPDDLILRLEAGKIYMPHIAERAMTNYFKRANLIALRELTLRAMANRVDSEIKFNRATTSKQSVFDTNYGILLVLDHEAGNDSVLNQELIRETGRMARALSSPWRCIVISHMGSNLSPETIDLLQFARSIGAITDSLVGDYVDTICHYSRDHNLALVCLPPSNGFLSYLKLNKIKEKAPELKILSLSHTIKEDKSPSRLPPSARENLSVSSSYQKLLSASSAGTSAAASSDTNGAISNPDSVKDSADAASIAAKVIADKKKEHEKYILNASNKTRAGNGADESLIEEELSKAKQDTKTESPSADKVSASASTSSSASAGASAGGSSNSAFSDADDTGLLGTNINVSSFAAAGAKASANNAAANASANTAFNGSSNNTISAATVAAAYGGQTPSGMGLRAPRPEEVIDTVKTSGFKFRGWWQIILSNIVLTLFLLNLTDYLQPTNLVMFYLLLSLYNSMRYGMFGAISCSVVSIVCFNLSMVNPIASFAVEDLQYLITFAAVLVISMTAAILMYKRQLLMSEAMKQARQSRMLYDASRYLAPALDDSTVYNVIARIFFNGMGIPIEFWRYYEEDNELVREQTVLKKVDEAIVRWCLDHKRPAGLGTHTLNKNPYLYLPFTIHAGPSDEDLNDTTFLGINATNVGGSSANTNRKSLVQGVVVLQLNHETQWTDPNNNRLILALTNLAAQAIERLESMDEARQALMDMEADRLKYSLIQTLSHDLKNPLNDLQSNAQDLEQVIDKGDLEHAKAQSSLLTNATRRMSRIMGNILELAKLQTEDLNLNKQWLDPNDLIAMVTANSDLCQRLSKFKLGLEIEPNCPPLYGDVQMLDSVLFNLLDNATRYCPEGSSIIIEIKRRGDNICLAVLDNGPGLKTKNAKRLFDPFKRNRKPSEGFNDANQEGDGNIGLGLGLAICKTIARVHDADLLAIPSRLGGACFMLALPYEPEPTEEEQSKAQEAAEEELPSIHTITNQDKLADEDENPQEQIKSSSKPSTDSTLDTKSLPSSAKEGSIQENAVTAPGATDDAKVSMSADATAKMQSHQASVSPKELTKAHSENKDANEHLNATTACDTKEERIVHDKEQDKATVGSHDATSQRKIAPSAKDSAAKPLDDSPTLAKAENDLSGVKSSHETKPYSTSQVATGSLSYEMDEKKVQEWRKANTSALHQPSLAKNSYLMEFGLAEDPNDYSIDKVIAAKSASTNTKDESKERSSAG